jgi:uncharacterized membrane protein
MGGSFPPPPPESIPPIGLGDGKAQTGRWISEAWAIVKADIGPWILMTLLFLIINSCVPLILQGPLLAGMQLAAMRKILYGRVEVGDLFKGFNQFGNLLIANIVISVFVFAGSLFCIIPGLVLAAVYQFTYLFIVDKKMAFWPAMEASLNLVKRDYLGYTIFLLVAGVLLNLLGTLACIVGLLVTFPIWYVATAIAYRELVGFDPNTLA